MSWYKKAESEERLPSASEVKAIVNELISGVQALNMLGKEQKYSYEQYMVLIDNDPRLNDLVMQFGEDGYEILLNGVEKELQRREENVFRQRATRKDEGDELAHLRSAVKGKNWEDAKIGVAKMLPMGSMGVSKDLRIEDDRAEQMFQRLYQIIYSGDFVDLEALKGSSPYIDRETGERSIRRLSEIFNPRRNIDADEDPRGYDEHLFMEQVFGHQYNRPPENVEIYRGVSVADASIRPGDWVTINRSYARTYIRGSKGAIIRKTVPSEDLIIMRLDINSPEFIYYPKSMEENPPEKKEVVAPMSLREFWEQTNSTTAGVIDDGFKYGYPIIVNR
jgi:hypothetical protein